MAGTVRDATLALLRDFGMTTIFGNPGSTELPMFRDFPDDFRYVLGLQESIVLGMADGFASASGNAAFINLHSSVGVGHAAGNLFTAFKNNTPLVITAGQQARSILNYDPFLFAQDPTEFPKPFVKWSTQPARAEDVPGAIARGYYLAMQPPMGPVFISVPVDDWDRPCDPIAARRVSQTIGGDQAMLAEVAEALSYAERPVLVVGSGVGRDGAWDEAVALAEKHGAAVWTAPFAHRAAFPEDHRLFAGFLAAGREAIVKDLAGYDLIVVLGAPVFTYHTEGFGPFAPEGAKLFQLVDDPGQAAWAGTGTAIVTGLKSGIDALLRGPAPRARPTATVPARAAPVSGSPLTDRYLLQRIAALRPADSIIVEEAPSARGPMHDHLPILRPDTFYTCASGGLGHGLPAAVGVALARKERVIALLGDGSAMYAIQGLWSAAQLGLSMSFVIVKNGRYEALVDFGRKFGLQQTVGTELPNMDFCAIARGQGVSAVSVSTADDLDAALAASFVSKGPSLIEVVVD